MKKYEYIDSQRNGSDHINNKRKMARRAKRKSSKKLRQKNKEALASESERSEL